MAVSGGPAPVSGFHFSRNSAQNRGQSPLRELRNTVFDPTRLTIEFRAANVELLSKTSEIPSLAARIVNNSKRTKTGYVEATPHLDIRDLRRRGIIAEGSITCWQHPANPDWKIIADLRSESHPEVLVETPVTLIVVRLVSRPARFGGKRWFFQDEKGRACEILYLRDWWLVSREAAKLSYRSQSEGTLDRLFARPDDIDSKLNGGIKTDPARGQKRRALLAEREKIEAALEGVGAALAGALHDTSKKGARAQRSIEGAFGSRKRDD